MKNVGGSLVLGLAALGLVTASSNIARADADYVLSAGTSRGANTAQLTAANGPTCVTCPASSSGVPMTVAPQSPTLAMLGLGLVGSEGHKRGGGELFTILGLGNQQTTGYTSFVTYAGLDSGRVFAHVGLGLGKYWGSEHASVLSSFAGNARVELGVRLTEKWIVIGRTDVVANNTDVSPFVTLGLQFLPYVR